MKTNLFLVGAAAAVLFTAGPLQGDGTELARVAHVEPIDSGSASQLPDPGGMRRQFFGTVAEVDGSTRRMVVQDDTLGQQALRADERTQIMQGDKKANWSDIRVGVMVDGVCVGAPGSAYAETINIGR